MPRTEVVFYRDDDGLSLSSIGSAVCPPRHDSSASFGSNA